MWFNDDDGVPGSDEPIASAFNTTITFTRTLAERSRRRIGSLLCPHRCGAAPGGGFFGRHVTENRIAPTPPMGAAGVVRADDALLDAGDGAAGASPTVFDLT